MSYIEQSVTIGCPFSQSATRLRRFFRKHGNVDGDVAELDLKVEIGLPGVPMPLMFRRSVIVTIQAERRQIDAALRYRLQWAPATPGPFPLFAGELFVASSAEGEAFILALKGDYEPPLGIIGEGFDVAVGNRIAQMTASDLLERIKDFIERDS